MSSSDAPRSETAAEPENAHGSLLMLALLSPVVGAASGFIGAVFRLALARADSFREALGTWAHSEKLAGFFLATALCAIAAGVAARLTRRYSPYSSGSGITHVEAVLNGDLPQAPFRLIPLKFIGGVLAIGSGLALGPEGPSVQMGASISHLVGNIFRRKWPDCRVLLAAGAGAGLAAVFNAPIAGAVFVLEELVRKFETRIAIAALGASATAIWVARIILGSAPTFRVTPLFYIGSGTGVLFLVLGAFAGFLGIVYNRTLLGTLAAADQFSKRPVEIRAAAIGAVVGMLAWFAPGSVGSGEPLIQRTLITGGTLATLLVLFILRLGLGSISYAAGTPGGLMAPILALGAQFGMGSGILCKLGFPSLNIQPEAFTVVGMAALLTAITRTPLTAIVLVIEMTASFTMFLPMLISCFAAMIVPTLLHDPPIYDSLRERTLRIKGKS
jgi:CIC family chloride channel protein